MMHTRARPVCRFLLGGIVALGLAHMLSRGAAGDLAVVQAQTADGAVPAFEVDTSMSKPLPNSWMLGSVTALAVDSRDHVWMLQNPAGGWPVGDPTGPVTGIFEHPPSAKEIEEAGKKPAPPVIEFDAEGNVVQAWGGPGEGYSWMETKATARFPASTPAEHGLFVDHQDNVWVTGNGHVALKFSRSGKFLLQIGELWETKGSSDTKLLGGPTSLTVDPKTNEVFIADGYLNHRVIVFDAVTGAYKRHWGAYGKPAEDARPVAFDPQGTPPQQFYPVHCVRIAKDGLVYVCDRQRNRIQVFKTDGTFVTEGFVAKDTPTGGPPYGSVNDVAFSADPEQRYLYVGDGSNAKIWVLRRSDLQVLGSVPSLVNHSLAVDSKGNLYTVQGRLTNRQMSPARFVIKKSAASTASNR